MGEVAAASAPDGDGLSPPALSPEDHAAGLDIAGHAIGLDSETFGLTWPIALIPLMLATLLLSAIFGDRA